MSCFIHREKEAVVVCTECGKNMCEDCSKLTEHVGVCPTCAKPRLECELGVLYAKRDDFWKGIIFWLFMGVLFCFTIVLPVIALYKIFRIIFQRKEILSDIAFIEKTLNSINNALSLGSAENI